MRSSRLPWPGSSETLVMRMRGRWRQLSARMAPSERPARGRGGGVEDYRRRAGRAGLGAQQGSGLFGHAPRVRGQVPALDELPALAALVAAGAVGGGGLLP